jgi:hypothetical protein
VIATNWGGPTEYLNSDIATLLDYELISIPETIPERWLGEHLVEARQEGHKMAEPNYEQLKSVMWDIYQNYFVYKAQAMQAREYVREKFQWHHAVKQFYPIIESLHG